MANNTQETEGNNPNISSSSAITYYKENPPTQEQAGDTAHVIHAVAEVTLAMINNGTIDGDTILVTQKNTTYGYKDGKPLTDVIIKSNNEGSKDPTQSKMLKIRFVGIDTHEVSHYEADDKGVVSETYTNSSGKWVKVSELNTTDTAKWEAEAKDRVLGNNARDWLLTTIGIDLPSLLAKKESVSVSLDLTIVIDRLGVGKTGDIITDGHVMSTPGMDTYGRYLSCVYVKNKTNGDWINLNKSQLLQPFGTVPLIYVDKDDATHMSPVFKLDDYQDLYVITKGGEDKLKTDVSGTYGQTAVDDRLDSAISLGFLKEGFEEWTTVIGDTVLFIPPSGVQVTKSTKSERVKVARSKNSIEKGTGHTDYEIRMTIFFDGTDMINGYPYEETLPSGEKITYYMHGLRQIISQFRKTPFLPIVNQYLNFSYDIEAVTLTNLTLGTVDGMPGLIRVELIMTDFEPRTHILGLGATENVGQLIHWPLFRYYYQKSFNEKCTDSGHTYFPPVPKELNGEVIFSVIKQSDLEKLAQEANLLAQNKVKGSTTGKTVDEVMFENKLPKAVKNNFEVYEKMMDVYKDFLDFYDAKPESEQVGTGRFKGEVGISRAVKAFGNPFLHPVPGMSIALSIPTQYLFMYLVPEKDYYLAENYYKLKRGYPWNPSVKSDFKIKFKHTNDFYLHNDFGVHVYPGYQNRIYDEDPVADSHEFVYGLSLLAEGITDYFTSLGDTKLDIVTPDICTINYNLQELVVNGILDARQLKIHNKIIGEINKTYEGEESQLNKVKFTNIIERMIAKNEAYDELYKDTENMLAGLTEAEKDQANLEELQKKSFIDDLELGFEPIDIPFSPASVNISFGNTFSYLQVLNFNTPTKQYIGGTDTVIQLDYIVEGKEAIKKFNYIYDYTTSIVRRYRSYISDGFIKIENELVNMSGVTYVVINNIDIKEVPDFPEVYNVRITLVAFDRTQRNKEELQKLASSTTKFLGEGDKVTQEETASYQRLIDSLKNSEVYPDLELPTNDELSGKGFFIIPNGGRYPDPDFYISYDNMFMISTIIKEHIVNKSDLGSAFVFDANTGHSLSFDMNKPLSELVPDSELTSALKLAEEKIKPQEKTTQDQVNAGAGEDNTTKDPIVALAGKIANGKEISGPFYPGGVVQTSGITVGLAKALTSATTTENINKLKNRFKVVGGIEIESLPFVNVEIPQQLVQTWVKTFCDKYLIPDDFVIRGLIHTLVQSEADAYHWESFNIKSKVPKGKNLNFSTGADNSSATEVGVMKLDFKGQGYSKEDIRALMYNPVANIATGIQQLVKCYKTTFSGLPSGNFGIYSPFELEGEKSSAEKKEDKKTESNVHKDYTLWNNVSKLDMKNAPKIIDDALTKPEETVFKKKWWGFTGDGLKNVALYTFHKDSRTAKFVDNAIKEGASKGDKALLIKELKSLKDDMVTTNLGKPNPRSIPKITVESSRDTTVLKAGDGVADLFFERGRWLAACLIYDGWSADINMFKAVKAFMGGFNPTSIQTGPPEFKPYIISFLKKITANASTQQMVTGSYDDATAYKTFDASGGQANNYFGDFNGDPALYIDDDSIFKSSLHDSTHFDKRGRLCRAFPTFFLCLIDEGNKIFNWKLHDNFYGYNSISDIQVIRSRKMAASTCVVQMSNMFEAFWNWDSDSMYQRRSSFADVTNSIFDTESYVKKTASKTRNADANKSMLKPGARLHIRLGYSSNVRDLPILFNGTITEIEQGEVIQIVAQGDGIELCNKIPASPKDTTESTEETNKDKNILERFMGYVTKSTSEPRNVIVDMFHTKGGFWKTLIYSMSNGYFFNANPLGIVHFGNPEFKVIFNEGGEVAQNIYAAMNPITIDGGDGKQRTIVAFQDSDGMFDKNDEPNFSMYLYNKTPWDVIQVCRMLIPDFVASVEPFEFRSTLFYGKTYYPYAYEYDYATLDTEKISDILSKISVTEAAAEKSAMDSASSSYDAAANAADNNTTTMDSASSSYDAAANAGSFSSGHPGPIDSAINKYSKQFGVSPVLIAAIIKRESAFDPKAGSGAGARGLMQLMPGTAKEMGVKNPLNIDDNVMGGTKYISLMLKQQKTTELALAAYNAGPGNVKKYGGIPPFKETQDYVRIIMATIASGEFGTDIAIAPTTETQEDVNKRIAIAVAKYKNVNLASPLKEVRKSFQQTHIMTSQFDIIDNKIKASEKGVYTNVLGTFVGQGALGKSASYQTPVVYADTDIWNEKQKTAMVDCQYYAKGLPLVGLIPFVNSLKTFFFDQGKAINIATSSLVDYMKDMYQGEIVVLGYPAIKPFDIMYVYDEFNQMNGLVEVQQVVHHFSVEGGYTTSITPDACVSSHDQFIKTGWVAKNSIAPIALLAVTKSASHMFGKQIFGFTRFSVGATGKFINLGLTQASKTKGFLKSLKSGTAIMDDIIGAAEKLEDVGDLAEGSKISATKFAKLKSIGAKQLESLKGLRGALEGAKASGGYAKAIEIASIKGSKYASAFQAGIVVANIAEVAVVIIADRALLTWVKRFIRNRQAISMTLLRQHGRELSAGINGHRGLVVGDSPGVTDSMLKGLLGTTLATIVLGNEPRDIANVTYSRVDGAVELLDVKHKDEYMGQYIADSSAALAEMSAMMAGTSNFSESQTQTDMFINGGGTPTGIAIVDYAQNYLGCPYLWGGNGSVLKQSDVDNSKGTSHDISKMGAYVGKQAFDCSGFMHYIYKHFGINIGYGTSGQQNKGKEVTKENIKIGDLIFSGGYGATHHVTMYIGNGKMIEAPSSGKTVRITDVKFKSFIRHIADLDPSGRPIK